MWAILVFIFCFVALATSTEDCQQITQTFYQTEDQWYDIGCDESAKVQASQTFEYQCRFLQKKMDIFGRKYYDFRVSLRNLKYNSFSNHFLIQTWSAWSECKNERQERVGQTCAGRKETQERPCTVCKCNSRGSRNSKCDLGGQCHCRPNIAGLNCDQCKPGYFAFPTCQRRLHIHNFSR